MNRPQICHRLRLRRTCSSILLCALPAVTLVGCQLPDLSGFAASAITVRSSLGQARSIYRPFVVQYNKSETEQFDLSWKTIETATDALVEYAQSLEAIAAAGKKGAEGAAELVGSIDKLTTKFGAAGLVGSEAANTFVALYGEAAKGMAAHTLAATTERAQPLIDAICTILAEKVADNLGARIPIIFDVIKSRIEARYRDVDKAFDELVEKRSALLNPLRNNEPADWADSDVNNLAKLDAVLLRLQPRRDAFQQELADARKLQARQERLFMQMGVTFRAFAAEHRSIRATLEANRAFTLTNVQHAAGELDKLIERIEEIRDNG